MDPAQDIVIDGATPFVTATKASIEKPVAEIVRCLDAVRAGDDIEAVHDIRVATRRLRALLSVVEPIAEPKAWRKFNKSIATLTDQLGVARDTDVFIEFLDKQLEKIDDANSYERPGVEAFRDAMKQERATQQVDVELAIEHIDADGLRREAHAIFPEDTVDG